MEPSVPIITVVLLGARCEVIGVHLPLDGLEEPLSRVKMPVEAQPDTAEFGGQEVRFPAPFVGQLEAVNTGDAIVVDVKLKGNAEVSCARCLTRLTLPLDVRVSEEFRRGTPPPGQPPGEQVEEDGNVFTYFEGDQINLDEMIRQNILLELPTAPLCSPDCKGLCASCGKNLNEGACDCAPAELDPRLRLLKDFVPRKEV